MSPATDRFREIYPDHAVLPTPAFPGAHDAIAAVRRAHGRVLLVTGKYTRNAQLHVDHLAFDVDHLAGEVWGAGKGDVLRAQGASVYVGDHVHDVEGALAAGITSVSVLTGGCTEDELRAAGTHVVLRDLTEFPAWLDGHLLRDPAGRARDRAASAPHPDGGVLGWRRQRVPAGRGGAHPRSRPGRRGDGLLRFAADVRARAGAGVRPRPRRRGLHAARPTSWRGRATAPTPATGVRSARPSCSTCSARWPPSTGTTRSRPAPTPTTRGPGSGPGSGRRPSAGR